MSPVWNQTHQAANLQRRLPGGKAECMLCPRNCKINPGKYGFCKVRGNRGGGLVTFNYGKSVQMTEEVIETEAVNHFAPGSKILSLGNVGCNMSCLYCQNWETSQASVIKDEDVHLYTPEQVVQTALSHNIKILSWTYNDPVVWHEFVLVTAKMAREAGLINLYKSAFYITPLAVDELLPHIDIFSISLKSMSKEYYRKITKGKLDDVLKATQIVHAAQKHVEISNLMITGLSDNVESAKRIAGWVLDKLGDEVPLHFVRFHPSFKYTDVSRTPIERIVEARNAALSMGVKYVYLGNAHDPDGTSTICRKCGNLLVSRFGLAARPVGLDAKGDCVKCGLFSGIKMLAAPVNVGNPKNDVPASWHVKSYHWNDEVSSLHLLVNNVSDTKGDIYCSGFGKSGLGPEWRLLGSVAKDKYRYCISKSAMGETGVKIAYDPACLQITLREVLDRAHFPTKALE